MMHDYLNCLVLKEQSCSALLSKCLSLQATHLSYRICFRLSRTFLIFLFYLNSKAITYNPLPVKACWIVFPVLSLSDLYYITRFIIRCQHFLQKKSQNHQKSSRKGFMPVCGSLFTLPQFRRVHSIQPEHRPSFSLSARPGHRPSTHRHS